MEDMYDSRWVMRGKPWFLWKLLRLWKDHCFAHNWPHFSPLEVFENILMLPNAQSINFFQSGQQIKRRKYSPARIFSFTLSTEKNVCTISLELFVKQSCGYFSCHPSVWWQCVCSQFSRVKISSAYCHMPKLDCNWSTIPSNISY